MKGTTYYLTFKEFRVLKKIYKLYKKGNREDKITELKRELPFLQQEYDKFIDIENFAKEGYGFIRMAFENKILPGN